jgi:hypothetical protein
MFFSSFSMSSDVRYLNVQYGTLTAEVEITGISRLGGVKSAIKAELGEAIPVAPALIQLYNTNRDQLINTWSLFQSLSQEYFTEGGSCVVIGTSPPPSMKMSAFHLHSIPTSNIYLLECL